MEFLDLLALGFGAALTPENLAFCLLGALLGAPHRLAHVLRLHQLAPALARQEGRLARDVRHAREARRELAAARRDARAVLRQGAHGLAPEGRARLVETMIDLAIADAANEAVEAQLTPDSTGPVEALWAMAWRARSAAWMGRNRGVLEAVLV